MAKKSGSDTRRKSLCDFRGEKLVIAEETITVRELLAWVSSVGADLTGVDLSGFNATHSNFIYIYAPQIRMYGGDFRHSKFCKSVFHQGDLSDSDFSHSDFRGCYLNDSKCVGADFSNCDMRGAYLFDADFTRANFSKSDLRGCKIECAILDHADLTGANIEGVEFIECDMNFTKLSLAEKTHMFRLN